MDGYRRLLPLLIALGLFSLSGASCPSRTGPTTEPMVRALPPSPTLDQVIQVVNRNSLAIDSFMTTQASLSGPGFPTLRASVAYQRPRRLRLRAETGLTGPELDLGSNEELFWFWVKRNEPPGVYYCRHEQFATSPARNMIPLEPDLLFEALGTTGFDPSLPHEGPYPVAGDRLQVRTIRQTAQGPATKVTVVDALRGWITEQHIYNAEGKLVASSVATGHRRDPLTNLVMPSSIHINCPPAQFSMQLDLGPVQINRLSSNQAELWSLPNYQGSPLVDLGNPNLQVPQSAPPPAVSSRPRLPGPPWQRRRY